jgi:hypothetical protein
MEELLRSIEMASILSASKAADLKDINGQRIFQRPISQAGKQSMRRNHGELYRKNNGGTSSSR